LAIQYHVNGAAEVYVRENSGSGADGWQYLGLSTEGVNLEFIVHTEDVIVDSRGPTLPGDVQFFGEEARITLDLIYYDEEVLENVATRFFNGTFGTTPSEPTNIGCLLIQGDKFFHLKIVKQTPCSMTDDEGSPDGWVFNTVYLADSNSFRLGTRRTVHSLTFRAIPDTTGVLFTNDQTP